MIKCIIFLHLNGYIEYEIIQIQQNVDEICNLYGNACLIGY